MILSDFDLFRVGVASPALRVADVEFNTDEILAILRRAAERECRFVVFPELCLTGYTCADLFYQFSLQHAALRGLQRIVAATEMLDSTAIIGLPIAENGKLYNCAAIVSSGRIAGIVPKKFLPNSAEYNEKRWFAPAQELPQGEILIKDQRIPFGTDILFRINHQHTALVGVEICEDLWSVIPPSSSQALAGAVILVNLSASSESVGKSDFRRRLVLSQSERCMSAYLYAAAGAGESTTDVVFGGHSMIAENGKLLAETPRFEFDSRLIISDIDIGQILTERQHNTSYISEQSANSFRIVEICQKQSQADRILRTVSSNPFIPKNDLEKNNRCTEIFDIQITALAKRLLHTGLHSVVIGVSGGLDSALALLAAVGAFDKLALPRKSIVAITMPGFGTTDRTRNNAEQLAELLGCTLRIIPIEAAIRQHFADLGHEEDTHDILYENAQARERTQILMDAAHQSHSIVVGTGDLSELALGWCTYNGDHISMYGINAGIPKTLVRTMIEWLSEQEFVAEVSNVLKNILSVPISPELLPTDESGNNSQQTESIIGPYSLHDFFLYYTIRLAMPPAKILLYANEAFYSEYDSQEIKEWLQVFYRRFFSQQFKRSCMPDGVKVGSVSLSPRGDWRMPSDAVPSIWLEEIE